MTRKFVLIIILLLTSQSFAATHLVPSQYATIQAGINAASEGDTVLVAPGTYSGDGNRDLTFNGVNLVLLSESGADVTIIDCQADSTDHHVAIHLNNGEDTSSVVDGFTITRFDTGIYLSNGLANIKNCVVSVCQDGILLEGYATISCRISNCIIEGCMTGIYSGKGGTIVENCILQNNTYEGISFFQEMEIRNCLIAYNGGVGVAHSPSISLPPVLIDHCTIVFNGLGFSYQIFPPKNNSSVIEVDTGTVRNSIIAYNSNGGVANNFVEDAHYNCINSNVYGNGSFNWQNDKYWHGDAYGNVSYDPLFCDTSAGDFTLQSNSYCAVGNNPSGSTIGLYDIGCAGGCCIGNRGNVDGLSGEQVDIADIVYFVLYSYAFGPPFPCEDEANIDGVGGIDIADLVYLVNYMFGDGPEPPACP